MGEEHCICSGVKKVKIAKTCSLVFYYRILMWINVLHYVKYIIVYVRYLRGTDCSGACESYRERLSVSKRAAQKFDMEKFKLKQLNDVEATEQNQVKFRNRFAALENLDDDDDDDIRTV